jgi:hypothetical protein
MYDDYGKKEYTGKGQGVYNTVAASIGLAGGIPGVAQAVKDFVGGCGGGRAAALESALAYERGKNYTDQTVIAALREGEQNRKEIIQQVVANKEELAVIKTKQECEEKHAKEIAELRAENTKLYVNDAIETAVAPLRTDIVRLRDGVLALRQELVDKIDLEAERRKCADGKIVCYSNATFAQKSIVGYTAKDATTATLAPIGNPLCCDCNPAA